MSERGNEPWPLDSDLLAILVCPVTHSPLRLEGDELVGAVGGLRYPVREGIPVLLPDAAKLPAGIESLEAFKRQYVD
ncbi:MAG: Trm112 family protein [Planctomycetota bacterium]